jgi:uncharacterized protein (DUF1684 family)
MTAITPETHTATVEAWRAGRDERLRSPDGWLALVGLTWLVPGENRIGAHPASRVVLHGHQVPPRVGSFWLEDGAVRFVPHEGVEVLHAGQPAGEVTLEDDKNGNPTVLEIGTLRFHVICRDERLGVRVRDTAAPGRQAFTGIEHYPIDPTWRIEARFEPAPPDATIEITDVTGAQVNDPTPGSVVFEREGQTWRIVAMSGGEDGTLWLIFADATNGTDTYAGGRFLYTEPLTADGSVVVDFNLAYNPPCVFSRYATCPLPPAENRLPIRIEAGELLYLEPTHSEG